jgi:hypothetical protein
MGKKNEIETPYGDWPNTEFLEKEQSLFISGTYAAPSPWWENGFPSLMGVLFLIIAVGSCVPAVEGFYGREVTSEEGGVGGLIYLVGWAVVYLIVAGFFSHIGRQRRLWVKMSRDVIETNGRRYARGAPHQFAIERHEKARQEAQGDRSGKGSHIYRDAVQVVMRYGERRVPIAEFKEKDIRKAEALLVRLQTVDQTMDQALDARPATAHAERDEFGPRKALR